MYFTFSGTAARTSGGETSLTGTLTPGLSVDMDVIVNFSSGTGAATAAKVNAGMHGANWGSWQEYHGEPDGSNTHSFLENHAVVFPGTIVVDGIGYDGSEGQGLTFDFTGIPTEHDIYQMTLVPTVTDCIGLYLVQFATTLGDNSYNNDTVLFAGSNFTIAQFSHSFTGQKLIYGHASSDLGAATEVPEGWVIVCVFHDEANQQGLLFVQDALTLEVLGASRVVHSLPANELIYIRLQDYLRYADAGEGAIRIKLVAFRNSDLTWPPYPITVPPPTSVSGAQTATDTITLTWVSTCQVFKVERNVNSGGWTTLQAAYDNKGVQTYADDTLSDGQSVQYRVTARIGSQSSSAVTSNTVVVSN